MWSYNWPSSYYLKSLDLNDCGTIESLYYDRVQNITERKPYIMVPLHRLLFQITVMNVKSKVHKVHKNNAQTATSNRNENCFNNQNYCEKWTQDVQ